MYDVFFEERALIPSGRFHEVSYEDLEKDRLGKLEELYGKLGLQGFEKARPLLESYITSLASYRKNEHPEIAPQLRQRIAGSWRRSFEEWGYPV